MKMSHNMLFGVIAMTIVLTTVYGEGTELEDSLGSVMGDLQKTYSAKYQLLDADFVKRQLAVDDNIEETGETEKNLEHKFAKLTSKLIEQKKYQDQEKKYVAPENKYKSLESKLGKLKPLLKTGQVYGSPTFVPRSKLSPYYKFTKTGKFRTMLHGIIKHPKTVT